MAGKDTTRRLPRIDEGALSEWEELARDDELEDIVLTGDFSWAAVVIVTVREVGVSMYRSFAAKRGISLPARRLGKWKAFFQFVAVGIVLLPPTYEWATVHDIVLWFAVALSVVSGLDIVWSGYRQQRRAAEPSATAQGDTDAV